MKERKKVYMRREPMFMSGKQGGWTLGFAIVLLCMVACSSAPSSHTLQSVHTSPQLAVTPLSVGRLLYEAHWSLGLAGWQSTGGWRVIAGHLEGHSSGESTLTIPYRPVVSDYALEIRFQVVQTLGIGAYFMLAAQPQPGRDGYKTGWREGLLGYIDPPGADLRTSTFTSDYNVRDIWHTYRVEVRENDLQMFDNGVFVGEIHSEQTKFLSEGPLSLNMSQLVLQVSQLRLLSL